MPFQRVPDTVLIKLNGRMAGQEIVNTFYGRLTGYVLADLESLASAVSTWVTAYWLPLIASNYSFENVSVHGLDAAIDLEVVDASAAGVGTATGLVPANNVCLAVKRASGFTGRGARGRIYIPITDEAFDPTTDVAIDGFVTAVLAGLDAMDTAISGAGFLPVIVHRVAAGVPLAEAITFTLIEWVVVDKVIDSMRRRLPKRGV